MNKETILEAIKELIKTCKENEECESCPFYDENDKFDYCIIKTVEGIPSLWSIKNKRC